MSSSGKESIRILYIGQKTNVLEMLQEGIENHECEAHGSIDAPEALDFVWIKNQKVVLSSTRKEPPNIVLVEMDEKPNRRLNFCEMLRYRLPKAAIIAVCLGKLNTTFKFDGELTVPLQIDQVVDYLCELATEFNGNRLEQGHISLNIAKRVVTVRGEQYSMTPKQCALLNMLLQNHNSVVTRAEIMEEIWETSYMEDTRTLDVHIRWLREKLESEPNGLRYIHTMRNVGYRFSTAEEMAESE